MKSGAAVAVSTWAFWPPQARLTSCTGLAAVLAPGWLAASAGVEPVTTSALSAPSTPSLRPSAQVSRFLPTVPVIVTSRQPARHKVKIIDGGPEKASGYVPDRGFYERAR